MAKDFMRDKLEKWLEEKRARGEATVSKDALKSKVKRPKNPAVKPLKSTVENVPKKSSKEIPKAAGSEPLQIKLYQRKDLPMSVRLQHWKEEKRSAASSSNRFKTPHSSRSVSQTNAHRVTRTLPRNTKFHSESAQNIPKGAAPASERTKEASASTRRSAKNDMRERLERWLAEKGKTPSYMTPANIQARALLTQKKSRKTRKSKQPKEPEVTCLRFENEEIQEGNNTCESAEDLPAVYDQRLDDVSEEEKKTLEEMLDHLLENVQDFSSKVASDLDSLYRDKPYVVRMAKYWVCRAKLAQLGQDDSRVVCFLEQAVAFSAEPIELVKEAVCIFVKDMKTRRQSSDCAHIESRTPAPVKKRVRYSAHETTPSRDPLVFDSSIIKFCLSEATPFKKQLRSTLGRNVVTPVRRSVRLQRTLDHRPAVIREHDKTLDTLDDLPQHCRQNLFYKPNHAVESEFNQLCELDQSF